MVSHGFETFWSQGCRPPVAALWQPAPPCAARLDPLYIKISDLEAWFWRLDAWMLEGLELIEGGDGGDCPSNKKQPLCSQPAWIYTSNTSHES